MPLDRKKKREERFEIENLLTSIRREFGDEVKVMENEPPDKFNEELAKSPFERIYVSSTFNQDFLRLK